MALAFRRPTAPTARDRVSTLARVAGMGILGSFAFCSPALALPAPDGPQNQIEAKPAIAAELVESEATNE
jgi:hypothetical protein